MPEIAPRPRRPRQAARPPESPPTAAAEPAAPVAPSPGLAWADRIARALGPWFVANHRDLEWRRTRDPYAIWVSEVMLQQTRVDTVKAYWGPFMARFPTVADLAAADEQDVLTAWSGLGYYRRARLLHQGARHVASRLGGSLPDEPAALREIPGIGRYTAGAIASIAHDRPAALVDGNVARVLSRLQALTDPKQQDAGAAGHWTLAQQIVEAGSPRILAQALMELGATVCTPQSPRCDVCPVRRECAAVRLGLAGSIPAPRQRAASPQQDLWAVAVRRGGRLLLHRRPREGLLAGLWCLPLLERPPAPEHAPYGSLFDRTRLTPAAVRKLTGVAVARMEAQREPVKHVFTHRVWLLWPARGDAVTDDPAIGDATWIAPGERPGGGIPTVTEKLLERLGY